MPGRFCPLIGLTGVGKGGMTRLEDRYLAAFAHPTAVQWQMAASPLRRLGKEYQERRFTANRE
jgi:hypothetical protein